MRRLTVVFGLYALSAALAVEPHVPLCRQLAPDPDLMAVLLGVRPEWLGLPVAVTAVRPELEEADQALPSAVRSPLVGEGVGLGSVRLVPGASGLPGAITFGSPASGGGPAAVRPSWPDGGLLPSSVNLRPGLATLPATVHTDLLPPPSPVSGGVAAALARLRAGDDSPELQTRLAALSKADLLAALLASAGWERADELVALPLAGLLIDRGDLDPTQPDSLPPGTIRWVADCLSERRDPRCVPLYQAMLEPYEAQRADGWVQALYGLGMHYRRMGDLQQAAAVWLGADRYNQSAAVQDDYRLEAAWDLRMAGDAAAADKLEDQLLQSKSGAAWTIGLVTYSRAQRLLSAGKHAELRALLKSPLSGSGAANGDLAAVQVALDGLLAESFARTGERELAAAQYRRVLDGYAKLAGRRDDAGLVNVAAVARRRLAELSDEGKG